jgi:hypothetical protein
MDRVFGGGMGGEGDLAGDGAGHFVVQGEDVVHVAIVGPAQTGSLVAARTSSTAMRTRDPVRRTDPCTTASTRSWRAISARFALASCSAAADVARHHAQTFRARHLRHQGLRHPVREILLVGIFGRVGERQHGEGTDAAMAGASARRATGADAIEERGDPNTAASGPPPPPASAGGPSPSELEALQGGADLVGGLEAISGRFCRQRQTTRCSRTGTPRRRRTARLVGEGRAQLARRPRCRTRAAREHR